MIKFDNDVPLPKTVEQTLLEMKPGQSFVVDTEEERRHYLTVAKRRKIKIQTATEYVGASKDGFRIWRLK